MRPAKITVPKDKIADFCRRWRVSEFSLFGSVLRDDFGPHSDIDVLVAFAPDGGITFENRIRMLDDLSAIFGREVDLVVKNMIQNPFRRQAILTGREVIYAA